MTSGPISSVLVYRLGSIGDFVVALPSLHLIRRKFPRAEITLLTNAPGDPRAAASSSVLDGAGLVDRYLTHRLGMRRPGEILALRGEIRAVAPQVLVYLAAPRGVAALWRDWLFFRWCGVPRIVGVPFGRDDRECRAPARGGVLWESEAHRLARCMAPLGDAAVERPESWDLRLSAAEKSEAAQAIQTGLGAKPFIALGVGTKQPVKDWGDGNWRAVLDNLKTLDFGLALLGGAEDRDRSQSLAAGWPNPVANFCGRLKPRVSAAVIARARLLLCHDSGPMHLAAAVGTSCVAVFSAHRRPGQWFPFGHGHQVFYPPPGRESIQAIAPPPVIAAARKILDAQNQAHSDA